MKIGRTSILAFAAATALFTVSQFPVQALSGTVVDRDQKPIPGASACYWVAQSNQLCVVTDDGGFFELPDGPSSSIRIFADGYLPRILPAVEQNGPIVLTRSATLLVIVVDETSGEGIDGATGEVAYASGRQRRFVTNRAGARLKTLNPGRVAVTAYADGYDLGDSKQVLLEAGEEARLELRLRPTPQPSPPAEN